MKEDVEEDEEEEEEEEGEGEEIKAEMSIRATCFHGGSKRRYDSRRESFFPPQRRTPYQFERKTFERYILFPYVMTALKKTRSIAYFTVLENHSPCLLLWLAWKGRAE